MEFLNHMENCNFYSKLWQKIYLPENHELVIPLLQKYYEEKCLEITEKRIEAVDAFLKIDSSTSCEEIYNNMDPKLRQFINPLGLTLDEKIERWNNMKYEPYLAHPEELVFNTDGGDKVRSKSEKSLRISCTNMVFCIIMRCLYS